MDMFVLVAGESWVQFDQSVVEEARRYGAKCDDWGTLTHDDKGDFYNSIIVCIFIDFIILSAEL